MNPSPKTPESVEAAMKNLVDISLIDAEVAHGLADDIMVELLRSLGYGAAMDAYESMTRWYA